MISKHFRRREFACKCGCGQDTVDAALLVVLERIREHFNAPIRISSGNRCTAYNRKVGGAVRSQHLISRAADIQVIGREPSEVYAWISTWHVGGLGRYATFTHVDTRNSRVRWG